MKNKPNEIELYAKNNLHFYVENSERYEYKDKPDFQIRLPLHLLISVYFTQGVSMQRMRTSMHK